MLKCANNRRGAPTVGGIIGAFKSITSREYINGVKNHHWRPFVGKVWQRNYYEHIIRDEESLYKLREYVVGNPMSWSIDKMNQG